MSIFIILLSLYLFVLPFILIYYIYKFWKVKRKKLSIFYILIFIFLYSEIICDIGCHVCGLEEIQARTKIIKDLKSRKLNIDNLKYIGHSGSCSYSYIYQDNNNTIDYVILSTWLHGVKLNLYNHKLDIPTPQTNKSNQETTQ